MKKLWSILILLSLKSGINLAQSGFSGLIGQYPLNGDGLDYSGNQNDMILQSVSATTGIEGWMYSGFLHNSTNATIKRPQFQIQDSITICGWVYSVDSLQASGIFYNGQSGQNGYGVFLKDPNATDYKGNKLVITRGGISETTIGEYRLPINTWKHVTLVKNLENFKVYVDGELKLEANGFSNFPEGLFSIGAPQEHLDNLLPAFKGVIDNVYVFNRALNQNEINEIMNYSVSHSAISQWKANFFDFASIEDRKLKFRSESVNNPLIYAADGRVWNCTDSEQNLPPGVYFVKLETKNHQTFQQTIVIR